MQTKRSASSNDAARASASAPELGAWSQPTPSGTAGAWPSSSVPCMTGIGQDPWWRAPMVNAMLGVGMLSPFAEVGDAGAETSDTSLSGRPHEFTRRRQKTASQRHLPSGPRFPLPPRRKTTPASSMREIPFPQEPLMPPGYSGMPGITPGTRPDVMTGIMPGMIRGMIPGRMPGRMPRRMPGMMPGVMPGMMPGMMPSMMPGMTSGMMPGMTPGMTTGMVPGMVPGMMPFAYPGMAPGMPTMPGAPMIPMMPQVVPGTVPMHPQQVTMGPLMTYSTAQTVAPGVVTSQGTGSQPRIVTVPIGGGTGGGGSKTSVIPMPIPMPMPLPMPSPGGGGGGQGPVILAGTSPPAAQPAHPYPAPFCHHYTPPPQQQSPAIPLAEAAAVTMMMQQMRLLLFPPSPRARRARPLSPQPPEPAPAPPILPQVVVQSGPSDTIAALQAMLAQQQAQAADALGPKKPAKASGKTKKSGKKPKASSKKSEEGGKEEEEASEADEEDKEQKKEKEKGKEKKEAVKKGTEIQEAQQVKTVDVPDGPKSQATQEGTTQGKGPDSNAPALSLSFPSTTALGDHLPNSDDVTEIASRPCYLVYACYALFIAFLVFMVVLALVPTLFQGFKGIGGLGFQGSTTTSSPAETNDTNSSERLTVDGGTTINPFFDVTETFGEVGVGDGLRDFELPSPESPLNTAGFALDWLLGVGLTPGAQAMASKRQSTHRLLPYFNERVLLRNCTSLHIRTSYPRNLSINMVDSRQFDLPLALGLDSDGNTDASVDRTLINDTEGADVKTHTTHRSSEAILLSTPSSTNSFMRPTLADLGSNEMTKSNFETANARTQTVVGGFPGYYVHQERPNSSGISWPDGDGSPPFPDSVYADWFSTEYPSPSKFGSLTTRKQRSIVTLSFWLPQLPTMDDRRIFFYRMLRESDGRRDQLSQGRNDGRN